MWFNAWYDFFSKAVINQIYIFQINFGPSVCKYDMCLTLFSKYKKIDAVYFTI